MVENNLLQDFTSFLSYKLGIYMGSGLFENYPDNYNEQIGRLAEELLSKVRKAGYLSPEEHLRLVETLKVRMRGEFSNLVDQINTINEAKIEEWLKSILSRLLENSEYISSPGELALYRDWAVDEIVAYYKRTIEVDKLTVINKEQMRKINDNMPSEAKYGEVFEAIANAQLSHTKQELLGRMK